MDILTQESAVQSWKAMRTPDDPLVADELEVLSLEEDVLPWVGDKVKAGIATTMTVEEAEPKIRLDFLTETGGVRNAMDLFPQDEAETAFVREALEAVIHRRK